jgi:CRISPR/Cas system-associated endonuclease Cas3-HD
MKRMDLRGRGIIGGPKRRKTMEQQTMPVTAKAALELWDAGKSVPAFQVETTPERQTEVWSAAFELIRQGDKYNLEDDDLSDREKDVARSIAHVAKQSGWAKMITQHVHRDSPAMMILNPDKAKKRKAGK